MNQCLRVNVEFDHRVFSRAKNIQTVLIARFLSGAFGSTGSTMVSTLCYGRFVAIFDPSCRSAVLSAISGLHTSTPSHFIALGSAFLRIHSQAWSSDVYLCRRSHRWHRIRSGRRWVDRNEPQPRMALDPVDISYASLLFFYLCMRLTGKDAASLELSG